MERREQEFRFHPGPVFAHIVVGDEINRASPKTQSAMLEVMEERQVTVDGTPYLVPRPFLVVATQNPVELDGTYHLPEAQIDRFMMRISHGLPGPRGRGAGHPGPQRWRPGRSGPTRGRHQDRTVDDHYRPRDLRRSQPGELRGDHLRRHPAATRAAPRVSPRGSLALIGASQAFAASRRREFVIADDIKEVSRHVLGHRMLLTAEAELNGHTAETLAQADHRRGAPSRRARLSPHDAYS